MGELQNRKTKSSGRLYQGQKKLEVHLTYAHFDPSLNTSFQILAKYMIQDFTVQYNLM